MCFSTSSSWTLRALSDRSMLTDAALIVQTDHHSSTALSSSESKSFAVKSISVLHFHFPFPFESLLSLRGEKAPSAVYCCQMHNEPFPVLKTSIWIQWITNLSHEEFPSKQILKLLPLNNPFRRLLLKSVERFSEKKERKNSPWSTRPGKEKQYATFVSFSRLKVMLPREMQRTSFSQYLGNTAGY